MKTKNQPITQKTNTVKQFNDVKLTSLSKRNCCC